MSAGVGVSVVNALSEYAKAQVYRDGKIWEQEYKIGKPLKKVKSVGVTKKTGTTIAFKPDASVFTVTEYNLETILDHLRRQAYLTKGVKIITSDERDSKNKTSYTFYFEGGIASYVRHLNHHAEPKHDNVFYIDKEEQEVKDEVFLLFKNYLSDVKIIGFSGFDEMSKIKKTDFLLDIDINSHECSNLDDYYF